jgi:hypothetical protein
MGTHWELEEHVGNNEKMKKRKKIFLPPPSNLIEKNQGTLSEC